MSSLKVIDESLSQAIKGDILIVDDVPENLQVLFSLLTAEGYEVRRVRSGTQALKVVSVDPPDLILLDIRMPDLDGYEVCEQLKVNPKTASIPVIFLSALEDVFDKVKAFSLGGADYISKPFKAEEVLARIQHQLTIYNQKRELIQAHQAAEQASKIKGEFLANMSHEVRTPLAAIIGFSQVLQMTTLDKEQSELIDIIYRNGQDLLALLDDILVFSKLEAESLPDKKEDFVLQDLTETLREIFEFEAKEKGVKLVFDISSEVPKRFLGPKVRLQQVLRNLTQNAIKFTQNGSVEIKITSQDYDPSSSRANIRFSVKDTGCGILSEELPKIFAPFTQADSSTTRQYGGVGLGLSISQKILQRMGSTLQVDSQPNVGSTFWFVAPLEVHPASQPSQASSMSSLADSSSLHPSDVSDSAAELPVKLLLVEDDPDNQRALTMLLENLGYELDLALNGQEALEMLLKQPYKIALMDCQMPVMDGYEATRQLRQWEAMQIHDQSDFLPKVVIGITAHAMLSDREKCLAAGMNDYISKPFLLEDLKALLDRWVGITMGSHTSTIA